MKKIYIAKRIPKQPDSKFVLNLEPNMQIEDIHKLYVGKIEDYGNGYTYNGPWILRPPLSDDVFTENKIPEELKPNHIWDMVKKKIESSNVFVGIINHKAYGTIAETGYACNCKNIAVYAIPEIGLTQDEIQDFWFIFQMTFMTESFWCDEDIINIKEFGDIGIKSVDEYKEYISKILPNFMK